MIVRGKRLNKGDKVEFENDGEVIEGRYTRYFNPYILIETKEGLWRVLTPNVLSIEGEAVE